MEALVTWFHLLTALLMHDPRGPHPEVRTGAGSAVVVHRRQDNKFLMVQEAKHSFANEVIRSLHINTKFLHVNKKLLHMNTNLPNPIVSSPNAPIDLCYYKKNQAKGLAEKMTPLDAFRN
eukprot:954944-Pelagomonas_calceolata.AAC.12